MALALRSTLDAQGIRQGAGRPPSDGLAPRLAHATLHELLSHTSGLRDTPGQSGTIEERALAESADGFGAGAHASRLGSLREVGRAAFRWLQIVSPQPPAARDA